MIQEKQIKYLLEIYREGNITRAAKKLFVSQPTLSRMLIDLESKIGTTLFTREKDNLCPTYAGLKYIEACSKVTNIYDSAMNEIEDSLDSSKGRIRLGLTTQTGIYLLPGVLERFNHVYPKAEITLTEGSPSDLEELIARRNVDLAIVYKATRADLAYQRMAEDVIFLMAPPSYSSNKSDRHSSFDNPPLDIEELEGQPFIFLKQGRGLRTIAETILSEHGVIPRIVLETDSMQLAHTLVQADLGFTFIQSSVAYFYNKTNPGTYYTLKDIPITRPVMLCHRVDFHLTKSMRYLVRTIKEVLFTKIFQLQ